MRLRIALVVAAWVGGQSAVTVPAARAQDGACIPHALGCLLWKFEYTHFSPDGLHLYFTYQYSAISPTSGALTELTSQIVARYSVDSGKLLVFRADCGFDYGDPASSPDGRYFVTSVTDRVRYDSEGSLQHLEIGDLSHPSGIGENTTRRITVSNDHSRLYFAPFFSRDSRTLYFVRISRGFSIFIFAYDTASGAIRDVHPNIIKRRTVTHPERALPPQEITYLVADEAGSIRYLARPQFIDSDDTIVFYGRAPLAKDRLLGELARSSGKNKYALSGMRLIYAINLRERRLSLHPASEKLDLGKRGAGAFRAIPGKGIFLLNGYFKFPGVDTTIYRYDPERRELQPYGSVDHSGYQWFDISPDLRWVAYTHAAALNLNIVGKPRRFERPLMVVKERMTGRAVTIDPAERRSELLDPHTCAKL